MTPPKDTITSPVLKSLRPRHSRAATGIGAITAFVFFLGGLYLMGQASSATGSEFWVFLAGILSCSFAFFIPLEFLRWFDGA